jgi:hypothetical protein
LDFAKNTAPYHGWLAIPNLVNAALRKLKHFAHLLVAGTVLAIVGVDSTFVARLVADLSLKGLSLNQIREHFHLIYAIDLTKHELQKVRYKAAQKAKDVNHAIDREVAPKVHTMEGDELFQGNENVILGAADKKSGYLLGIKHAPDRTEESLSAFFRPIARKFTNIRVVITDLFRPYVDVVKILFAKAQHLLCHVHGRRAVMRKLDKLEARLRRLKRQVEEGTRSLERARHQIQVAGARQAALAKNVQDLQRKIKSLEKKKRVASQGRTKTVGKQLASARARLARYRDNAGKLEQKVAKLQARRDALRQQVRHDARLVARRRQDVLQSGRLARRVYDLLEDRSPVFENHKAHLLEVLGRSRASLAPYLAKFIKNHAALFSLRKARDLAPNHQNTNRIEGIFGLFRPLLNSTRLLQTPAGINAYGELFRLYHNTTPPYTGPRNNSTPAGRLGVKLHGKTYLDLILPTRQRMTVLLASQEVLASNHVIKARPWPGPACQILAS